MILKTGTQVVIIDPNNLSWHNQLGYIMGAEGDDCYLVGDVQGNQIHAHINNMKVL
jgi:hypothetical protein